MIREQIRPALISFFVLTVITGILYPAVVTGISQIIFRDQANGSLIFSAKGGSASGGKNGQAIGSALIGQPFDDPKYLWGRLSATSPAYNASSSSGSNYGPMHSDFIKAVKDRVKNLKAADPTNHALVPVDLVTASGSGLDPHISFAGAYYQIPRIARVRGISETTVKTMIQKNSTGRFLGVMGEPVVNVLKVNLALDDL